MKKPVRYTTRSAGFVPRSVDSEKAFFLILLCSL